MNNRTKSPTDRAVVLGGSVAGLLAARALADVYDEVVVVERDELPVGPAHRRGVPQARHIHSLLAGGLAAMEELFDGLTAELTGAGAPSGDMLQANRICFSGHRFRPGPSGLTMLGASRPMLEATLRARVRALPAVTVLDRCDVSGLKASADGTRVIGARVIRRADGSPEEILAADLVIDATGRGSRTPTWLEALGCPPPPVDELRIGLGYTSRTYRPAPGALGDDLGVLSAPTPDNPRGGALTSIEDGQFLLTLCGVLGDHPATDLDEFDAFAADLLLPDIHDVIIGAEPLTDPVAYRFPASVRRRYERMRRLPEGLLIMGDAACSFNPIYGQGMSVAALEALALRRRLQRGKPLRSRRFQREIGRIVATAWAMTTGGDLSFPDVDGRRPLSMRLINSYIGRIHAGAANDPALGRAFLRVSALVDPPSALLRPGVAARTLRSSVRRQGTTGRADQDRSTAPTAPIG